MSKIVWNGTKASGLKIKRTSIDSTNLDTEFWWLVIIVVTIGGSLSYSLHSFS